VAQAFFMPLKSVAPKEADKITPIENETSVGAFSFKLSKSQKGIVFKSGEDGLAIRVV